jgi:hypothetical protein
MSCGCSDKGTLTQMLTHHRLSPPQSGGPKFSLVSLGCSWGVSKAGSFLGSRGELVTPFPG